MSDMQYTDDVDTVRNMAIAAIHKLKDVDDAILRIFAREALDDIQEELDEAKERLA